MEEVLKGFRHLKDNIKVNPKLLEEFNRITHFFYEDIIKEILATIKEIENNKNNKTTKMSVF